jgi:hypothetical protein
MKKTFPVCDLFLLRTTSDATSLPPWTCPAPRRHALPWVQSLVGGVQSSNHTSHHFEIGHAIWKENQVATQAQVTPAEPHRPRALPISDPPFRLSTGTTPQCTCTLRISTTKSPGRTTPTSSSEPKHATDAVRDEYPLSTFDLTALTFNSAKNTKSELQGGCWMFIRSSIICSFPMYITVTY